MKLQRALKEKEMKKQILQLLFIKLLILFYTSLGLANGFNMSDELGELQEGAEVCNAYIQTLSDSLFTVTQMPRNFCETNKIFNEGVPGKTPFRILAVGDFYLKSISSVEDQSTTRKFKILACRARVNIDFTNPSKMRTISIAHLPIQFCYRNSQFASKNVSLKSMSVMETTFVYDFHLFEFNHGDYISLTSSPDPSKDHKKLVRYMTERYFD